MSNNIPSPAAGSKELQAWYRKHGELGDSLDRNDGTIGAIESKKQLQELEEIVTAQNNATYEAVMATIKQLYSDVTEESDAYYKVSELRQSIAKIFSKESEE